MSSNTKSGLRLFLPIVGLFNVVLSFFVLFGKTLKNHNIDQGMLIGGNIILFAVTASSFYMYRKALFAGNTQAFLRNFYTGMMIKFFVCIAAAFIYVYNSDKQINQPALFSLMFLYLMYTFVEVSLLMKQSRQIKQNRNA